MEEYRQLTIIESRSCEKRRLIPFVHMRLTTLYTGTSEELWNRLVIALCNFYLGENLLIPKALTEAQQDPTAALDCTEGHSILKQWSIALQWNQGSVKKTLLQNRGGCTHIAGHCLETQKLSTQSNVLGVQPGEAPGDNWMCMRSHRSEC